jgi:hypothetical protein
MDKQRKPPTEIKRKNGRATEESTLLGIKITRDKKKRISEAPYLCSGVFSYGKRDAKSMMVSQKLRN